MLAGGDLLMVNETDDAGADGDAAMTWTAAFGYTPKYLGMNVCPLMSQWFSSLPDGTSLCSEMRLRVTHGECLYAMVLDPTRLLLMITTVRGLSGETL